MDQSTFNLITLFISIPVSVATLLGVYLTVSATRPKLKISMTPVSLGYRDKILHQGEFSKGVNSIDVPRGVELIELAVYNKRGSSTSVEEIGLIYTHAKATKASKRAEIKSKSEIKNRKQDPTYRSFRAANFDPAPGERYQGGQLEILAHSSRVIYIDAWDDLKEITTYQPLDVSAYIRRSGKYIVSPLKRSFLFRRGAMSFFREPKDFALNDIIIRHLIRVCKDDADIDEIFALSGEIMDRLKYSPIESIPSNTVHKMHRNRRYPSAEEVVKTDLWDVLNSRKAILDESKYESIASLVLKYAYTSKDIHSDYYLPRDEFQSKLKKGA